MGCSFRWTVLSNCVIDQGLIALILDHVEVLLWDASYVMVFWWRLACSNPAWMLLLGVLAAEILTIACASFRMHSHVTTMVSGLLFMTWLRNANLSSVSLTAALFIVDEFLVLVKQPLFQFVISLWILLVLLLLGHITNCLAIALSDRLAAVIDVGILNCVLTRGDKLVVMFASDLCSMLGLMRDELIMDWEAIEGLIVWSLGHGLQVRRHLLAMEVNGSWRRLLNFVRLVNLLIHWHIVILVLSTRSAIALLALQLLLDSAREGPHILLLLRWWLVDLLVFNVAVHVNHMLVTHAIIDLFALTRILIACKGLLLLGMHFA